MNLNNKIKSILFIVISSILFTTMNLFSKLSTNISLYQKAFVANITAVIVISIIIFKNRLSFIGNKENRKNLIIRGICGTASLICLYYSIEHLILSDSAMLSKLGPIFATIFGVFISKDKINKRQILFLFITLIGAVFIIKPKFSFEFLPALIGLFSAASAGMAFTMIRIIGNKENSYTIIFYNIALATLISFTFMFFNVESYSYKSSLVYMVLGGLCIAFGQIFLTLAYKNSPASSIAIYDYIGLIISGIYGLIIFHEIPDIYSFIGYIIIFVSAIFNFIFQKNEK